VNDLKNSLFSVFEHIKNYDFLLPHSLQFPTLHTYFWSLCLLFVESYWILSVVMWWTSLLQLCRTTPHSSNLWLGLRVGKFPSKSFPKFHNKFPEISLYLFVAVIGVNADVNNKKAKKTFVSSATACMHVVYSLTFISLFLPAAIQLLLFANHRVGVILIA